MKFMKEKEGRRDGEIEEEAEGRNGSGCLFLAAVAAHTSLHLFLFYVQVSLNVSIFF